MGCHVDAITLSTEQKLLADSRVLEAGLSELVHVHLCDFRSLPPSFEHTFDACISCEMVEVSTIVFWHFHSSRLTLWRGLV